MLKQTYQAEEAEEILTEAARRVAHDAGGTTQRAVTHEQLVAMAEELGIDPAALETVVREGAHERTAQQEKETEQQERQAFIVHRRADFYPHLWSYVGVNTFLVFLNLLTSRGYFWAIWPLMGWGIGVFFHAVSAFATGGSDFEKEFATWRKKRRPRRSRKKAAATDDPVAPSD